MPFQAAVRSVLCRMMVRPGDLEHQLLRYWDPNADLALSQLERLEQGTKQLQCQHLDAQGEHRLACQALLWSHVN